MAVAFDALAGPSSGQLVADTGTSITANTALTIGAGSNRALLALLLFNGTVPAGLAMTWDGVSLTAVTGATVSQTASSATSAIIYGLVAPASGQKAFAASWTGTKECTVYLISFTGVDQTGGDTSFPNGTSNRDIAGGSNPATVSITSTANDATVAAFVDNNTQGSGTPNDTVIDGFRSGSNYDCSASYSVGSGSHSSTLTWGGNCNWGACATSIAAVGGAATGQPTMRRWGGVPGMGGGIGRGW